MIIAQKARRFGTPHAESRKTVFKEDLSPRHPVGERDNRPLPKYASMNDGLLAKLGEIHKRSA